MPINAQSSLFLSYSVYLKNNFGPAYPGHVVTEVYHLGALVTFGCTVNSHFSGQKIADKPHFSGLFWGTKLTFI